MCIRDRLEVADRFDTVTVHCASAPAVHRAAAVAGFNLRVLPDGAAPADATGFGISLDELSDQQELQALFALLAEACGQAPPQLEAEQPPSLSLPQRSQPWLSQPVFHQYRSESELLRYIQRLVSRDLSLVHGCLLYTSPSPRD